MSLNINMNRLWGNIEKLAEFTEDGRPYTRRAFGPLYLQARDWLKQQFIEAGLQVEVDAGGNLIGRRAGLNPDLPPISSGSHTDTVPEGGRFDGIAGVLAALEVAHSLKDNNIQLNHPLEVIDFLAEEPSDYGLSRVGSRALTGDLSSEMLQYTAPDGSTLADGIRRVGGEPSKLNKPLLGLGDVAGFFELHIEQGPVLEAEKLPIGIVTNIVGITRVDMKFIGTPAHSGTTPMDIRADALVAASKLISAINDSAREWLDKPEYLVATVGKLDVTPNGSNVVPGRIDMTLEVRSSSDKVAKQFVQDIEIQGQQVSSELGVKFKSQFVSFSPAVDCTASVQQAIETACRESGTSFRFMPSGAGHDTACMTKLGPAGMIFIPCLGGRSHCPEEWSDSNQLATGTEMLYQAVINFDHMIA